jgi:hypothetical protein
MQDGPRQPELCAIAECVDADLRLFAAQTLGLVFVAVYQKALKLLYVDALLEQVKQVT